MTNEKLVNKTRENGHSYLYAINFKGEEYLLRQNNV